MRSLHSRRLPFLALASTILLLAARAVPTQAAPSPDAMAIAQAYGDLSVFILDVAAGHDGRPRSPASERALAKAFARQMLSAYVSLSVDQQQAAAELPWLRDQVQQAWPILPVDQRTQLQQQWAAVVEDGLSTAPCSVLYRLARAYLMPADDYWQRTNERSVQCWNAYWQPQTVGRQPAAVSSYEAARLLTNLEMSNHEAMMSFFGN